MAHQNLGQKWQQSFLLEFGSKSQSQRHQFAMTHKLLMVFNIFIAYSDQVPQLILRSSHTNPKQDNPRRHKWRYREVKMLPDLPNHVF